jgi:hypothetical protein
VAAIVALTLVPAPAAAANTDCKATIASTGRTYSSLQAAVNAARPRARIIVKGKCYGTTVIAKRLTITGTETERTGKPVLTGRNEVKVLRLMPTAKVRLKGLTVQYGGGKFRNAGAIDNRGTLDLVNVKVQRNLNYGIRNTGTLRTWGNSRVSDGLNGGGIFNKGLLIMNGRSKVGRNYEVVSIWNAGRLVMNDASSVVGGNPGVWNTAKGSVMMRDTSSIHHNPSGGVLNMGRFRMFGSSSIRHNYDGYDWPGKGGGVLNRGTLIMRGPSSIHDNRAEGGWEEASKGGGVYNEGTVIMRGASTIHDNAAAEGYRGVVGDGGGIFNEGGTLDGVRCAPQQDANVFSNRPDDCAT